MPRQLRIEYPGAFYHVYSRGNQKQAIFLSDEDRYYFLKILRDAHERLNVIVHLYCLMKNHYHLGLETPGANLSQIMHFINSAYSIYLNVKHERCGHLFQGRFKAILVQTDVYAKTLAIYIHGNPVKDRIVDHPELYQWSSCQDYYGTRKPPNWLNKDVIMGCFGCSVELLRAEHRAYLDPALGLSIKIDLKKAARVGIWGDKEFIDKVRRAYLKERIERPDPELCELKRLRSRPELPSIKAEVDKELGTDSRYAKKCTIFLAHKYANYKLREIGEFFGIGPTAVSSSYLKTAKELSPDCPLYRAVERARARLFSSGEPPQKSGKV
jgi:REP element-mobilizing transposase RayT